MMSKQAIIQLGRILIVSMLLHIKKVKQLQKKLLGIFIIIRDNSNKMELTVINPGGVMGPQLGND